MKNNGIAIITPVYNDWTSFQKLVQDIDAHLSGITSNVFIIAVDDGSTETFPGFDPGTVFKTINQIEIVHLARNTGHQRAIVIGLSYLEAHHRADRIIVMDADGEDRPSDLPILLAEQEETNAIIFAKRGQRRENRLFRLFNGLYRVLFYLLTGRQLFFGNFCCIPGSSLRQIVFLPEIWGHFAAGILRSGLKQKTITLDRAQRYHGKSKMNFVALIIHGISAISVYTDILSVRMMLLTLMIMLATVISAAFLIYIRYFTELAIPGWATTVGFGLLMILSQSFLLLLSITFNVLNARSTQPYIPIKHFEDFLLKVGIVYERH